VNVFEAFESTVRSYCRSFPTVFTSASGAKIVDQGGREYVDFFSGAGALNYGHNNPRLKRRLLEYVERDGITHALDMSTAAKEEFLSRFVAVVLGPRGLDYKVQFTGPTGTNAVEAALKLARKATGRRRIVHFRSSFHGMTLGALSVTANPAKRASAGVPLDHTLEVPYDGDLGPGGDTLAALEAVLDRRDGEKPAAVIVETIQCEGGVKVASREWLRRLAQLVRAHEVLLIVDDIQVGCGRTGTFFSFEDAGLHPDLVCLSKSIGGFGLPLSLLLIRPALDVWTPGEHNGTFRGNNLAFVTGAEALTYWEDDRLSRAVAQHGELVRRRLEAMVEPYPGVAARVRGRGLIQGLPLADPTLAGRVSRAAFERGLIVETAGPRDEVLKLLPPLVIETAELADGLDRLAESLDEVLASVRSRAVAVPV
jgi:diaminobutyrate-2-oxoglutarate transaminase